MQYQKTHRHVCLGLIPAGSYIVLNRLWANLPEVFPGAGTMDSILAAVAIGYLSGYVFFVLTKYLPAKAQYREALPEVKVHIDALSANINSFKDTVGDSFSEDFPAFFNEYYEKELWKNDYLFTTHHYLGSIKQERLRLGEYINQMAFIAEYSCKRINQLLPNVGGNTGKALDTVAARAGLVLRGEPSDSSFPILMSSIESLWEAAWKEHLLKL